MDFLGLFTSFLRICSTFPSDIGVLPDPFTLHKQPSSLSFLCHVQICFLSGTFWDLVFLNRCANARCTVLNDCVLAYSRTQNAFCTLRYGISRFKIRNT